MARKQLSTGWLGNFRRSVGYMRPHARPLMLGLLAAVGVSVFYTSSLSSIIPALNVIFADHETLADWLNRNETERRLGVALPSDVPDNPDGLVLSEVRETSNNADRLHLRDQVVGLDGEPLSSYALLKAVANADADQLAAQVRRADTGAVEDVQLTLEPSSRWWATLRDLAMWLPQDRFLTLVTLMGAIVVVSLLGSVCRFINESLVAIAVQRTMHDMRAAMADRVLRLPVSWHSSRAVGDTLGRFSNDLARVEVGVWTLFGKTIREPLKAVGVLVLTIAIDWRIIVIAALGLPLAALVLRLFGRTVKRAQKRASRSWGVLLDHLDERLAGIRIVKAYNMEGEESKRFSNEGQRLMKAQTHIEIADAAVKPALETLATLAVAGFIIYGGSRVFAGQIEPHVFFGAVVCLGGMFDPVRKLGNVNNRIQAAEAAAARVFELIDTPTEEAVVHEERLPALPSFEKAIEFRNVTFAYPNAPDLPVLADIDLTVAKGQVVALVGPNGSGKTTLVSLLLRFFEPSQGEIRIDGRNIADVSLHSLRSYFGLVTQDAVIFSGPARYNIAYGADNTEPAQVERAVHMAHLEEFIEDLQRQHDGRVTQGYDTEVSAQQLSGGQRQRIAIARAILRDPPILILDEATSQVDAQSEQHIQEALEDVTRGRTTFIIAHRFSTIRKADLIVVLDQGRIVGAGRHEDLFSECPVYHGLCQTQFAHA